GSVRASLECAIGQDPDRLLYLLSLKMKPVLERAELIELLSLLGSLASGPYRELPAKLRELSVEVVPDGRLQGAGIRHVYQAALLSYAKEEEPLMACFLTQLCTVLDAWNYEARVELRAQTETGPLPQVFVPRDQGGQAR